MECDNLLAFRIHDNPDPLFVFFMTDEAKHLIDFRLQRVDEKFLRFLFGLEIQVIWQLLIKVNNETKQPAQTNSLHSADTP